MARITARLLSDTGLSPTDGITSPKPELVSVQYLRALAAMMVVAYHAIYQLQAALGSEGGYEFLASGVDVFFVISGFIMVFTTAGRSVSTINFYQKRIVRIAPLYWSITSFMLAVLIIAPHVFQNSAFDLRHIIASDLFYPWIHPVKHVQEPLVFPGWTLNYEMFFYFIFGILLNVRRLGPRIAALSLTFVAIVACQGFVSDPDLAAAFYSSSIVLEFVGGAALGYIFVSGYCPKTWVSTSLLVLGVFGLGLSTLGDTSLPRAFLYGVPSLLLVGGTVFLDRSVGVRRFALGKLLGDASYSIYLVHFIAQAVVTTLWKRYADFATVGSDAMFLILEISIGAISGVIVYKLVEKPLTTRLCKMARILPSFGLSACWGISESSWARVCAPSSWWGLAPPSTSVLTASKKRRGWPACATDVRHSLCLYVCTTLILLRVRRSPTLSTAARTNVMRHQATLFEQIVELFPWHRFEHYVRKHDGDAEQRGFTSRKHFLALLAGALGGHQSLRPLVAALAPNSGALRLLGGKAPARSTLADATRERPAELFIDLLDELIGQLNRPARGSLRAAVRLIDATYLGVGRRMQRWLGLHKGQVAAKLHVVFDPCAQRPTFFAVTPARINDNTAAKCLLPIEPGATYVFDLGYYDFAWWARLAAAGCIFVTRLKSNTPLRQTEAREIAPHGCVLSDHVGLLPERLAASRRNPFDAKGRAITIRIDTGKVLRLFTNDLTSPAEQIAALYKERWQIELFFKWIKQNLKITRFIGTSENAIRAQIAVAFIAYLLVRLIQAKQPEPYRPVLILLIVRTHLFVRRPIAELLDPRRTSPPSLPGPSTQLCLPQCN